MVGSPDVVQKLWKMELTIHKAQVNSIPKGKSIGLFSVTDNRYVLIQPLVTFVGLLGRLIANWFNLQFINLHVVNARSSFRNKLPWSKERMAEVKRKMEEFFGDAYSFYQISSAGSEDGVLDCFPLPTSVTEEIFWDYPPTFEQDGTRSEKGYIKNRNLSNRVVVTIDNSTSPAHSLLQISCKSRKGLLYDCLRIVKNLNLKVSVIGSFSHLV